MSKTEILAELPKLSPQERGEIHEQLWRLGQPDGVMGELSTTPEADAVTN